MEFNQILSKYQELKYTDAKAAMAEIEKVQSIIKKTEDSILMARMRYYIAECQYYNGKIEEAYQSCLEGEHSLFYCKDCEEVAKRIANIRFDLV